MSRLIVQKGFQEKVFSCNCDIAFVGGAMGSGKSYSLVLEVMKHVKDPNFRCGIFRKNRQNLLCSGGLWEELGEVADNMGLKYQTNKHLLIYKFKTGASVHFCHGNHPNFKNFLKGTQFTSIFIDEGDEFDEEIFKFLMARLRSKANIKPYMRITTNPSEGWIKGLIKPFLNEDEYPIPELSGVVHYLYFIGNDPIIKRNKEDFLTECDLKQEDLKDIRTFTFISGKVTDNRKLLENNPEYLANLKTLSFYERDKYLYGWWGALPKQGLFKESQFKGYMGFPDKPDRCIVTCDPALSAGKNNDYSVATCWALIGSSLYLIDMMRGKWNYNEIRLNLEAFLEVNDFADCCYIEDYQAGTVLLNELKGNFKGISLKPIRRDPRHSKVKRAYKAVSFMNYADVYLPIDHDKIRKPFLREICGFSSEMSHRHDDICDTFFDACIIFSHSVKKSENKTQTTLNRNLENLGSMSRVSA